MSKKQEFIDFIEENCMSKVANIPENVLTYWNALKQTEEVEKPLFTDNGKIILDYMQKNFTDNDSATAKKIAEGMGLSSRTVSGGMKKLCTDGYVEKLGASPAVYALTELGRTITIN